MNKVSVITCTYNRAEQLQKGIMSILRQYDKDNMTTPLEIVVVDDGSTDETRSVVEALILEAKQRAINFKYIYLDHPEPRISCIPRNVGIKQASGDVLIFTEPEGLHVGNTIERLLYQLEANPDNTILASQVWTMGEKIYKELTPDYFRLPIKILKHPYAQLDAENKKAPDSDWAITGETNCNAGVLFATKKKWLLDIGGFDEDFFGHAWDDFDLFTRLALYGKGILKISSIPIIHLWHEKNYPYNIYEAAEANGKKSEARAKTGEYRANIGKDWGKLEQ